MSKTYEEKIRLGTMAGGGQDTPKYIRQILPHGFESFEVVVNAPCDVPRLARECLEVLDGSGAVVSALGSYGNPLLDTEQGRFVRGMLETLIDEAHRFGCGVVVGFSGRIPDRPIEESLPRFAEVWGPLCRRAGDKGVRLALENCSMGGNWQRGDWNIAHNPDAWELIFNAVPADNLGLEWEPCHQMVELIDPLPQLRKWVKKIFHVHGKDATILWDVIREHGIAGSHQFAFHRTPGLGDSNWTDIISELRRGGFAGSIDIEGWHDPVYREQLEMTGQVRALRYLKECRGGAFVENPTL
jgi:sugar phosphate isomerase/epimerase